MKMRSFLSVAAAAAGIAVWSAACADAFSIAATSPTSGAQGVALDASVTVTFDAAVSTTGVVVSDFISIVRIADNTGAALPVPVRITGAANVGAGADGQKVLTFDPYDSLAPGSEFRVTVSTTAKDTLGTALAAAHTWQFTSIYRAVDGNTIVGSDGKTTVVIPANTLPADGYCAVSVNPLGGSAFATATQLDAAESAVRAWGDARSYPIDSTMREFAVYDGAGALFGDAALHGNVTVTVPFPNADGDRYVDGTSPPVLIEHLRLYRYDTAATAWVPADGVSVNAGAATVSATTTRLSLFVLIGRSPSGLAAAYAYPVPFMPNDNAAHTAITFTRLIPNATIKIYTVSARLVRELTAGADGSDVVWDARNENGETVASGVYLYRICRGSDEKKGRLVIIR